MPSNTDNKGQIVFDAGKRIRQSLGNEFTNNVETSGSTRLNLAGASGAIRATQNNTTPEEKKTDFFSNIKHTNPIKETIEQVSVETPGIDECQYRIGLQNAFTNTFVSANKFDATYRSMTGIDPKSDIPSMIESIASLGTRGIVDIGSRAIIGNSINSNKSVIDNVKTIGATSAASSFINTMLSINHQEFDNIAEVPGTTSKDIKNIRRISYIESAKYNTLRTISVKVVPAAIKIAADKFVPANVKSNLVYRIASGYNLLSTAAGFIFGKIYSKSAVKYAVKMDNKFSTTDINHNEYVRDSVKSMAKMVLSTQVNPDMYVSGVFAVVDTADEIISHSLKMKKDISKSKALESNLVKDPVASKIKVLVVKPSKSVSKITKVSK